MEIDKCKFVHDMIDEYKSLSKNAPRVALLVIEETIREVVKLINELEELPDNRDMDEFFSAKDKVFQTSPEIKDNDLDSTVTTQILERFNDYIENICKQDPISNVSLIKIAIINETIKELISLLKLLHATKKDAQIEDIIEIKRTVFMVTYKKFMEGFLPLLIELSLVE